MRLRNIRGARETIAASEFVIKQETEYKGRWNELFGNQNPIHIEIGMGKGKFLTTLAQQNPTINYIGIEKYSSVLIRAVAKQEELTLPNLLFIRMEAEYLADVFAHNEVARIYLNFSDPWPKDRHAKRRLTSKEFLDRYHQILLPEGEVIFKTDNRELFDYSMEQVPEAGWKLVNYTYDLHESEFVEGNVMTEYEEKFVAEGHPICRLTAVRDCPEKQNAE